MDLGKTQENLYTAIKNITITNTTKKDK